MRDTQKTMTISATSFRGCKRFSPLLIYLKRCLGSLGLMSTKKSTGKVSFCGATTSNKTCWGAAGFNGQSQRRCCSQFPADVGRRCQEVWRLLAGVWNSPGFLLNHNRYCFGFRDDVKNTIWDECLGVFTLRGWKLVVLVPYGLL